MRSNYDEMDDAARVPSLTEDQVERLMREVRATPLDGWDIEIPTEPEPEHRSRASDRPVRSLAVAMVIGSVLALVALADGAHAAETENDGQGIWRVVPIDEWTMIGFSCPVDVGDLADELPLSDRGVTWQVFAYDGTTYTEADVLDEGEGAWLLQRTGADVRVWAP